MIILTCANIDKAGEKYDDEFGVWYKDFSFKSVIQQTVRQAEKCGYIPVVYDLGQLGIGEPFHVSDETFAKKGYYTRQIKEGYKSRSLFKPEVVKFCLNKHKDFTVYLDGDAQLIDCIDEILTNDYDIGVTLRKPSELETEWHKRLFEIAKYVNAGVIFFNPTPATFGFIDEWEKKTHEVGNDQMALNQLVCPEEYPQANSILTVNGIRIKFFPCEQYNYWYFDEGLEKNIKILHFKGLYRKYFPFDWKKRLYCRMVVPIKNIVSTQIKKLYGLKS